MSILTFVISSVFTFSKQPSMALMSIYECLWKGADKKCFQRPRGAKTDFFCLDSVKHLLTTAAAVCVVFVQQLNNQWRLSGKKLELKESNLWTVWPILSGNRGGNLAPKRKQIVTMIDVDFQCCCKYIMSFQFCRE